MINERVAATQDCSQLHLMAGQAQISPHRVAQNASPAHRRASRNCVEYRKVRCQQCWLALFDRPRSPPRREQENPSRTIPSRCGRFRRCSGRNDPSGALAQHARSVSPCTRVSRIVGSQGSAEHPSSGHQPAGPN